MITSNKAIFSQRAVGIGAIALAIIFNLPVQLLGAKLRLSRHLAPFAQEVLARFADGGDGLVWAWYVFGLSALMFVPLGIALSITPTRLQRMPALAIGAAVASALSGLVQAMGLLRWVFVVPVLAQSPESAIAQAEFALMNAYAGVAIGEHMGQIFTALFVGMVAIMQVSERKWLSGAIGGLTVAAMIGGSGGGLALALGESDALFSLISVGAYMGLTLWLITTGIGLIWSRRPARREDVVDA